ncbi:hypothetical protein EVAR_2393_1 [Eumeta japonica]|uniref:Uncharacterized protein n=1 Tax=Eumeta variegata TaxID=151549 RepID=A0A4C1SN41_EUMVA|nr:hypothetical protein EVAR_2393_1 [Eumeta japonica]
MKSVAISEKQSRPLDFWHRYKWRVEGRLATLGFFSWLVPIILRKVSKPRGHEDANSCTSMWCKRARARASTRSDARIQIEHAVSWEPRRPTL